MTSEQLLKLDMHSGVWTAVADWRTLAVRALRRMYLPEQGLFAFRLRPAGEGTRLEGISGRYTAIVLIGLATEPEESAREVFDGQTSQSVCERLVARLRGVQDIGEVALTLWAARLIEHPSAADALARLRAMTPLIATCPTVELAWCLTALTAPGNAPTDAALASGIAQRLLDSFKSSAGLFPHWPAGTAAPWSRAHVACFADQVYPIQALSYFYRLSSDRHSFDAAARCARQICALQGEQGQWWWHYDVRTGRMLEGYPVYSVHQDGMGPMALFALEDVGGPSYHQSVARSVQWLIAPPETHAPLVDPRYDVIWRKVARREPNKLTRRLQALASRLSPELRAPGVDRLFPPGAIDYETRPYHMGWLLHAFPADRLARLLPVMSS
jgi:hypothetical protein